MTAKPLHERLYDILRPRLKAFYEPGLFGNEPKFWSNFADQSVKIDGSFVLAWSQIEPHTDHHERWKWSALLILRNPGLRVVSDVHPTPVHQPPGTMVILNIAKRHALMGEYKTPRLWAAACLDFERKPTKVQALSMWETALGEQPA